MSEREIPQYLYHYTSLDKLALIFKNKTIRLNPLTKMDDLQEQKTADIENIGRFIFVSSWTSDDNESIPMWKMYTDPQAGVRIKLKSNPFSFQGMAGPDHLIPSFKELSVVSPQILEKEDILFPIQYTNDKALLEPKISDISSENLRINVEILGKYKNTGWKFQQEWRYIIHFYKIPTNLERIEEDELTQRAKQTIHNIYTGREPSPIEYYDLPIDPLVFSTMEITVSPQLSAGNRVILESLLKQYNKTASLHESVYLGLL